MADVFWACWDGGGNLTPSMGVARALEERGHSVRFFGRHQMVERVEAAGLSSVELAEATTDLDRYSFHPLATVFGYTSSPAVGEEVAALVKEREPDVVVIDAMLSAALDVADRFDRPTVVMLHTLFDRLFDMWRANVAMQSDSRRHAGFDGLPGLDVLWGQRDVLHVNALAALDRPAATAWTNVVHGAPVLAKEPRTVPYELPWGDDGMPTVLLSFSTVVEQRSPVMLQRSLDALAGLSVHVVATTGDIVTPDELTVPPNAHLLEFADHDALMECSTVLVGHGGHGTTMRALSHGLPIVGIPAKGGDQAPITRLLEEWGVGRALPGDARAGQIREATTDVLRTPGFRQEARRRAAAFVGLDGASLAADSVEAALRSDGSAG
jgi:UDP:flavonoid glycosyltransferase YjiC (YdhE family)